MTKNVAHGQSRAAWLRVAAAIAGLSVILGSPGAVGAGSDEQANVDAQALFDRVRVALGAATFPRVVRYVVVVATTYAGRERSDRYDAISRPSTGDFRVRKFSRAESANPQTPSGIDVGYSLRVAVNSGNRAVGSGDHAIIAHDGAVAVEKPVEPFAVPELSPTYGFGLRACAAASSNDVAGSTLKAIGRVTSVSRRYEVRLAGREAVSGVVTEHLTLRPLFDPERDRLRDVWIDATSEALVQARVASNFAGRGTVRVPWIVRFTRFGAATAIASETAEAPVRRGRTLFDTIQIRFEELASEPRAAAEAAFFIPPDYSSMDTVSEPADTPSQCPVGSGLR